MDNFLFLPRAIASTLYDLAFAAAVGILLCRLWLTSSGCAIALRNLRFSLITCATALLLSLGVQVILITAVMTGTLTGVTSQMKDVLLSTHSGRLLIPALAFSLLLGTFSAIRRQFTIPTLAVLFAMAAIRAATGHSSSQGDFTLPEAMQFLHLVSTAIWAGSVMAASFLVIPHLSRANDFLAFTRIAHRLSATAAVAVFIVIASGIYNAWLGLSGILHPLAHNQWGVFLALKSLLVTIAVSLGLYNRLLLRRKITPLLRFTNTLRIEALLIVAILTLSAFLANSPAAMSS